MSRVDLLKLKQVLNKIPDHVLEEMYVTHNMCTESGQDGNPALELITFNEKEQQIFEEMPKEEYKILEQFTKAVWEDAKTAMICIIDDDKKENYIDDYG